MKNNDADQLIRNKVESLDTLSGGIVYGKEEAWERLQSRMDNKHVAIGKRYPLAAAAVLLVVVTAVSVYYYSGREVFKNKSTAATIKTIPTEPAITQPDNVAVQPEGVIIHTTTQPIKQKKGHHFIVSENIKAPIVQRIEIPVLPDENKIPAQTVATKEPTPTSIPMKVVHINDVTNYALQNKVAATVVNNEPVADLRKMPVLHIVDIEKEEYQVRKILKENRISFGPNLFPKHGNNEIYPNSDAEEYNEPHHLLKNLFNTQN